MKYLNDNQQEETNYIKDRPKIKISFLYALNNIYKLSLIHND